MKRIFLFLATLSPGLFLIGYNIGTGSITPMAAAGAAYGMTLVWPLLISCVFTYILIVVFGRYTAVTGDTALHSYRRYFGNWAAIPVLIALLGSEWVSSMGVMGVVTQVVQEWSRPLTASGEGISPILSATVFGALVYALFWQGQHRFFERVLALFVGIMGLSFVATVFMVVPDAGEVIRGLAPELPTETDKMLSMAAMVGTTMGAILYVVRSILVQEKGWKVTDLKLERRDALISAGIMFLLRTAVMTAPAGTLHPRGEMVENAIDMVRLFEPLMGRFAVSVFVGGIVCAGLSSFFPIVLLGPWLIADYEGSPRDMRSTRSRLLVLFCVLLGLVVPVFGGRPVQVMIASQALITVISPLVLILMWILINRRELMGEYTASRATNAWMTIICVFSIAMAVLGVVGLWGN